MQTIGCDPKELVGSFRSFGADGPVYEVTRVVSDATLRIVVVETAEELDYPVQQAAEDPEVE